MDPVYIWALSYWPIYIVSSFLTANCDCGKQKLSVFLFREHRKLRHFVVGLLTDLGTLILWIVLVQPRWIIAIWVVYTMLSALRIYYHEKDKIKRAAKALGRVVIGANGRLAIAKE